MTVLVPVRYPLDEHSSETLRHALDLAEEADEDLIVLHVDLFQDSQDVTRDDLRHAVESAVGDTSAIYTIREGFMVEETILEEAASREVDTIVIGASAVGRLRRTIRRLSGNDPDIEGYLRQHLDVAIEVAD